MSRIDDILNKIFVWDEKLNYSDKVFFKDYLDNVKTQDKENLSWL